MIRSIIERTGVKIDVEDDGRVNVASADEASSKKAIAIIMELTATAELNKTYMGKVQRITDFGAFVEIIPGTDGLLHVSEIARHRVQDVRDELKEGDQLLVKVISIDPSGKIRLSRKALLAEEEGGEAGGADDASQEAPSEHASRPPRPHGAHDRGRGGRPGGPGGRDRRR
jgi:polyribonucleotide nucleotidyltransferase